MTGNPSKWELLEAICGGFLDRKLTPEELLADIRANSAPHFPEESQDDQFNYEGNLQQEISSNKAVTMTECWSGVKRMNVEVTPIANTRGKVSWAGNTSSHRQNLVVHNDIDAKLIEKATWNETWKNRMKEPGKCVIGPDWIGVLDPGDFLID
jgi:hypothetical protein